MLSFICGFQQCEVGMANVFFLIKEDLMYKLYLRTKDLVVYSKFSKEY